MQPGETDLWAFHGMAEQTVFLKVRSAAFEPAVSLRSPDGLQLAAENKGDAATGTLRALRLPKTGRYTVNNHRSRGVPDPSADLPPLPEMSDASLAGTRVTAG